MATFTISTSAGLVAALGSASAGDTILLQSGDYSAVNLRGFNFATAVNITSADPSNPATLRDLVVRDSSGLKFSNIEFNSSSLSTGYAFQVFNANNVTFNKVWVHGSMDKNALNDASLLLIQNSKNVTVTNSEFEQGRVAISHIESEALSFSGNSFHDLRLGGIWGGGSSYVTISGNSFTDLYPMEGDHPDAVNFFTTNTTVAAHDISVTDNVITRGSGGISQGIFFRDQVTTLPFSNVTITGNMLVGTMYNGICIAGGRNVEIADNIVASLPDMKSWVRVENVTGALVTNNDAGDFLNLTSSSVVVSDMLIFRPTVEQSDQLLNDWLASHPRMANLLQGLTVDASAPAPTAPAPAYDTLIEGTDVGDLLTASGGGVVRVEAKGGNDKLTGNAGNSQLHGGSGDDTYVVVDGRNLVVEASGGGVDQVVTKLDYVLPTFVENLQLMDGAFTGTGNELDNVMVGNKSNNVLMGLAGNDQLRGADGNDNLSGGEGADVLFGGAGADWLNGGTGADRFVFAQSDFGKRAGGVDTIGDFEAGDRIDLQSIDAAKARGDNAFAWIGSSQFTGKGGELRYYTEGQNTYVAGDINGDKTADVLICLAGSHVLSAGDFIL